MVAALVSLLLRFFFVKVRTNLNGLRIFEDWTPSLVLLRVPPRTRPQLLSTGGRAWLLLWSLGCLGFFVKVRTNLNGLRIFEDWTPSPVLLRVPPRTRPQLLSTGGRAWLLLWSLGSFRRQSAQWCTPKSWELWARPPVLTPVPCRRTHSSQRPQRLHGAWHFWDCRQSKDTQHTVHRHQQIHLRTYHCQKVLLKMAQTNTAGHESTEI